MTPIIMHIDMNSFFASCEQQDNVEWRGKPVGVCEHLGGILIAASIEAKRWGIGTGTPVWEAKRLFPKILLTHTHPSQYRLYSKRLKKLVGDYTHLVEQTSIDEVFIDLTKACNIQAHPNKIEAIPEMANPFAEAANIGREIKRRMKTEVGDWLTCSVGIAENKILAKIGSNLQKPNGMVAIGNLAYNNEPPRSITAKYQLQLNHPSLALPMKGKEYSKATVASCGVLTKTMMNKREGDSFSGVLCFSRNDLYKKLSLTDIPGIGKRQEKNLNALGIRSLEDLKQYPKSRLVARFGIRGYHLHALGQLEGSFKPQVEEDNRMKSIGHIYTLPREYRNQKFFIPVLYKLCEMVGRRLRRQRLMGNILHFYIHDKNYDGFGKSQKLKVFLYDGREIFLHAARMYEEVNQEPHINQFKLIGVTVAGLVPFVNQLSLFGTEEKTRRLAQALDAINEKYGDFAVCRVPILATGKAFRDSVGFGRIKER